MDLHTSQVTTSMASASMPGSSKARIAYTDDLSISAQDSSLGLPGCYWVKRGSERQTSTGLG